jgi:hypothetical protein
VRSTSRSAFPVTGPPIDSTDRISSARISLRRVTRVVRTKMPAASSTATVITVRAPASHRKTISAGTAGAAIAVKPPVLMPNAPYPPVP